LRAGNKGAGKMMPDSIGNNYSSNFPLLALAAGIIPVIQLPAKVSDTLYFASASHKELSRNLFWTPATSNRQLKFMTLFE